MKNTKILCTIGPSSQEKSTIQKMLEQGMDAARINTAHGTFEEYEQIIDTIRSCADIPIVLDIKGPELRLRLNKPEIKILKGDLLEIGDSASYPLFWSSPCVTDIQKGDRILIQDGTLEGHIVQKKKNSVIIKFEMDFILKNNKNTNIVGRHLSIPPLSAKDKEALRFARKKNIDYIALSFTRDVQDVYRVRKLLENSPIGIIAKIENEEGIKNIDQIIENVEGVMVARGDLGVELPLEKIPLAQKEIIKKCNQAGKLVITATQMLESMTTNHRPTRAEVSDVANAILDGTDAVMLSGETANGKFPVQAVTVMSKIAREVEKSVRLDVQFQYKNISDAITKSIFELSKAAHIDKIVTITNTGYTARMMSRFHSPKTILAVTPSPEVKRKLNLHYGIRPILAPIPNHSVILECARECLARNLIQEKDTVVFTAGIHTVTPHTSNLVEVHLIKDLLKYGITLVKKSS